MINWPDLPDICCDMRFVDVTEQVKQLLEENDVPYEIKELPIKSRKIPYFGPHPSTLDTSIESLLEYINSGFEVYGWDKFVFEKASWVSGCWGFGSMHPIPGFIIKHVEGKPTGAIKDKKLQSKKTER